VAARYLIGIDLGTTNSAVAFVDTATGEYRHPGGKLHRPVATHQEHLEPAGPINRGVPDQHHGGRRPNRLRF
jgi:hypothetical protein